MLSYDTVSVTTPFHGLCVIIHVSCSNFCHSYARSLFSRSLYSSYGMKKEIEKNLENLRYDTIHNVHLFTYFCPFHNRNPFSFTTLFPEYDPRTPDVS